MMKRFLRYFPLILALLLSGCEGMTPDNSRIENQMADLQRQIDELRAGQERLNQSVTVWTEMTARTPWRKRRDLSACGGHIPCACGGRCT